MIYLVVEGKLRTGGILSMLDCKFCAPFSPNVLLTNSHKSVTFHFYNQFDNANEFGLFVKQNRIPLLQQNYPSRHLKSRQRHSVTSMLMRQMLVGYASHQCNTTESVNLQYCVDHWVKLYGQSVDVLGCDSIH